MLFAVTSRLTCGGFAGTALTEQHARLIKRYADEVILVLMRTQRG